MFKLVQSFIFTLVVVFVVIFILGYQTEIAHSPAGLDGALFLSSVATTVAAIALLIFGFPLHFALKNLNKDKLSYYIFCGALLGFTVVVLFKPLGNDAFLTLLLQGVIFSVAGAFTAGVFFGIIRKLDT